MKERYEIKCASFLLLTKYEDDKEFVLLQRRFNTGVIDGKFDVSSSGHLEEGETVRECIIRETKEEIGVSIYEEDLKYVSTIHANFGGIEYLLVVFQASKYQGKPRILEIDKCNELVWCDINELPIDLDDSRKVMINNYLNGIHYDEFGFK